MRTSLFHLLPALVLAAALPAPAQNWKSLNYQGELKDVAGNPLPDSDVTMTFRIFAGPSGGTALFTEVHDGAAKPVVKVRDGGRFNVIIGEGAGGFAGIFDGGERWLELELAGNPPVAPRQKIAGTPYALYAAKAASADTATNATNATNATIATNATNASSAASLTGAIAASQVGSGTFTADRIPPIDSAKIVDGTITTTDILDGTITGNDINSIPLSKITGGWMSGDYFSARNYSVSFSSYWESRTAHPSLNAAVVAQVTRPNTIPASDPISRLQLLDTNGDVQVELIAYTGSGTITADVKNFVADHPGDPGKEIVYASIEGPEAGMYHRGTVQLEHGRATIVLPDHFSLLAAPGTLTVTLTPNSLDSKGVGAGSKSVERIEIGELLGGTGSYPVDFMVTAVRKGHEDYQVVRPKRERATVAVPAGE